VNSSLVIILQYILLVGQGIFIFVQLRIKSKCMIDILITADFDCEFRRIIFKKVRYFDCGFIKTPRWLKCLCHALTLLSVSYYFAATRVPSLWVWVFELLFPTHRPPSTPIKFVQSDNSINLMHASYLIGRSLLISA
jgi:hypothetical protein